MRRVPPGPNFWLIFLPLSIITWGAWGLAGTALGALVLGRLPTADEAGLVGSPAMATVALCVFIVLIGHKIERALEIANWIFVRVVLLPLPFVVAPLTAKPSAVLEAAAGSFSFGYMPPGAGRPRPGAAVEATKRSESKDHASGSEGLSSFSTAFSA